MIEIALMADMAKQAGNEIWPSLDLASQWFDRASIGLSISLAIGLACTVVIVWLGIVKEHHWDLLRERANEKIATVELDAAKSNAEAAKAHERIAELSTQAEALRKDTAEANARASEAQLALERFKAPRLMSAEQEVRIRSKVRPFSGTPFDLSVIPGDPEAVNFALQIAVVLEAEKWSWVEFNHPNGPFMQVLNVPGKPNVGLIGSWAVVIQTHAEQADRLGPAAQALAAALDAEGFIAAAAGKPPAAIPNTDTMHIIIGKKIDPATK